MMMADYHECNVCKKGGSLNAIETDLTDRNDCPIYDFYCDEHLPERNEVGEKYSLEVLQEVYNISCVSEAAARNPEHLEKLKDRIDKLKEEKK